MTRNRDTDQESDSTTDHPFAIKEVDNRVENQDQSTGSELNRIENRDQAKSKNNKKEYNEKNQEFSAQNDKQSRLERKPGRETPVDFFNSNYVSGGKIGGLIYIVGIILMYMFTFILNDIPDGATIKQGSKLKWAGQIYHGSHYTKISGTIDNFYYEWGFWELGELGSFESMPEVWYRILPMILLIIGGYILYQNSDYKNLSTKEAAAIGSSITFGYLIFALLGRYLFRIQLEEEEFVSHPELAGSVLIVGLLYPLIFGGIGGIIAAEREPNNN